MLLAVSTTEQLLLPPANKSQVTVDPKTKQLHSLILEQFFIILSIVN